MRERDVTNSLSASRCASVFTCLRGPDLCSIIADLTSANRFEYGPGNLFARRDKRQEIREKLASYCVNSAVFWYCMETVTMPVDSEQGS